MAYLPNKYPANDLIRMDMCLRWLQILLFSLNEFFYVEVYDKVRFEPIFHAARSWPVSLVVSFVSIIFEG